MYNVHILCDVFETPEQEVRGSCVREEEADDVGIINMMHAFTKRNDFVVLLQRNISIKKKKNDIIRCNSLWFHLLYI